MDYKILIILLALLLLVILTYRELILMKNDFTYNVNTLIDNVRQDNSEMVCQLQNNMIKCVGHVKNISSDNLQQLHKITMLNNQPMMRIANHYTETDESMHTGINIVNEPSDCKNIFQKNIFLIP